MGVIDTAINWAKNHTTAVNSNFQYVWAGEGDIWASDKPTGWDCARFVCAAYKAALGENVIPWCSTETLKNLDDIPGFSKWDYSSAIPLQAGDIIYYTNAWSSSGCGHAVMFLGKVAGYSGDQDVEAMGKAYGIKIASFNHDRNWQYIIRYTDDTPGTSAYGYMSETPSAWNSGSRRRTSSSSSSSSPQVGSNVVWHSTDEFGGGYYTTNQSNFTPYIATVSPDATNIDYESLINSKVSGMMFCAGWMYDDYHAGHVPRKEYIAPHLKEQIKGCQEAGMQYALYAIVRAKNRIEADKECRSLYYVISQYPPSLGLWLKLDMHNPAPPTMNETCLDCYYKFITDWGLAAKCGLYVSKSELLQITWNKYQNKFYLWLDDHVDQNTLNTINDNVLKSGFFEVE